MRRRPLQNYNDSYGHLAGDDCLKAVAQAINQVVKRPDDLVARYGGEELAVILPRTALNGAAHIAEAIRRQVYKLQIPHNASTAADVVTLSLGMLALSPRLSNPPKIWSIRRIKPCIRPRLRGVIDWHCTV
ncbi:MAG: diguanylate cyclase [Synechococcales cyanobacterium RU_4_20]|nr:diguanylate cyclase [Synechococcales cyanobacterium RU_4_20]